MTFSEFLGIIGSAALLTSPLWAPALYIYWRTRNTRGKTIYGTRSHHMDKKGK